MRKAFGIEEFEFLAKFFTSSNLNQYISMGNTAISDNRQSLITITNFYLSEKIFHNFFSSTKSHFDFLDEHTAPQFLHATTIVREVSNYIIIPYLDGSVNENHQAQFPVQLSLIKASSTMFTLIVIQLENHFFGNNTE